MILNNICRCVRSVRIFKDVVQTHYNLRPTYFSRSASTGSVSESTRQPRILYLQPISNEIRSTSMLLGLTEILHRTYPNSIVYQIARNERVAQVLHAEFGQETNLGIDAETEVESLNFESLNSLQESIFHEFQKFKSEHSADAIVVLGFPIFPNLVHSCEQLNAGLASIMGASFVLLMDYALVESAYGEIHPSDVAAQSVEESEKYSRLGVSVRGVIVRNVPANRETLDATKSAFVKIEGSILPPLLAAIPLDRELQSVRLHDVAQQTNASVICGHGLLDSHVHEEDVRVVSVKLGSLLQEMRTNPANVWVQRRAEVLASFRELVGGDPVGTISKEKLVSMIHDSALPSEYNDTAMSSLCNRIDIDKDGMISLREAEDFTPSHLIVCAIDRVDIVAGILLRELIGTDPGRVAGILLTGTQPFTQYEVHHLVSSLMSSFPRPHLLPVLTVQEGTYETVKRLHSVRGRITSQTRRKIDRAKLLFSEFCFPDAIHDCIGIGNESLPLTPKMFQHYFFQRAKEAGRTIVLPEGYEPRVLQAADAALEKGIANIVLLGNKEQICSVATQYDLDISRARIEDPENSENSERYAQQLYELRKHKGVTIEEARDLLLDVNYFGTLMVEVGDADGLVSGSVHTTAATVRPALQIIKTKPGISIVSSVFFMALPQNVLLYADCAINTNPTAEELSQIAITTAETAKAFGIEPKIVMLSFSTGTSQSLTSTTQTLEKVTQATDLVRAKHPELPVISSQYDTAVDFRVAQHKLKSRDLSVAAGKANVSSIQLLLHSASQTPCKNLTHFCAL